ncbi:MAG: YfhO family protein [Clostridia bacterium]|nr:YfhO family protein [Clostridia bacterium]
MNTIVKKLKNGKAYDNRFIFLAMFGSLLISLLVAYCYNMIPFGNHTILRMDLYHQYGPLFAELYERVKDGSSFLYSWNAGGGSSFLGNFYNYLSSPLSLLILLFSHENIPVAIGVMIFTKATIASATFTWYLKKSLGKHSYITAGFGVLYAFSGYFIAYYWNLMWLDAFAILPIVLLGIERIINKGKPLTFILALALTMFSNYYMAYMVCMFSVIYFIYYFFTNYNFSSSLEDFRLPSEKDKPFNKGLIYKIRSSRFFMSGVTFAFGALTAALCVAFALVPTYFILKACSATSGTFPEEFEMYNNVFDFLANHLASVEPTIRSSGDDVLPNVYCSVATAMLVPLFYFTKSISLREKISTTALLGVLFISFNTNYLNYIWHGFHYPNDLPYRFSFMYTFIILVVAFKTLTRIREFKPKELLGIGFGAALFIVLAEKIGSKNVDDYSVIISLVFAIIYSVAFYIFSNKKYNRQAAALFLFCCFVAEYAVANTDNYVMNQELKYYSSDYEDFVEIKNEIDTQHKNDNTYRMELTSLRTRMDPCWYNYNGVSIFSSMAYEKLANLHQNLGLYGNYINSYTYNMQTPVYNAMFALDYIVNNSDSVRMNDELFTNIAGNDTFTAYENKYSLPIAYMVNSSMTDWDYDNYDPFTVQSDYFERATGIADVFETEEIFDISGFGVSDISNPSDGSDCFYFTADNSDGSGEITVLILPEETQNLYLYVDSSNLDTLTVEYDGNDMTQDVDDEHYILDLGECAANEAVTLRFTVKEGVTDGYADFMLRSINMEKFEEGYNILKNQSLSVETFTDTEIKGTVTAKESGILYTSIPYDTGWKITVDGKEIDKEEVLSLGEALIGIHLSSGTHTVEFKYTPQGFVIGLGLTTAGIIILLAYILFIRKRGFAREIVMCFDRKEEPQLAEERQSEIDRQNAEILLREISETLPEEEEINPEETTEE